MEQDGVLPDNADYDHGGPKHRGFTRNGKMHAAWEFYRRDGSLMRSGEFHDGRQVGTWRTYDRSGAVVKETVFPAPDA
jgi:antitoxin component YwqK of YwqJK toxin-antitoxin module